jgi:hypothetical protein
MPIRPLGLVLFFAVVFILAQQYFGARQAPLETAPLVERAVTAYRQGDDAKMEVILAELEALRPQDAPYSELTACSKTGYRLRRIESARQDIGYLHNPSVVGLGEVPRLLYLEDYANTNRDAWIRLQENWPSHDDCKTAKDGRAWHIRDDKERGTGSRAWHDMAKTWRKTLESRHPDFNRQEHQARELLAVNGVVKRPEWIPSSARASRYNAYRD